jgi:hypothetical protein
LVWLGKNKVYGRVKRERKKLGMVAHACNSSTHEAETEGCLNEFEVGLSYITRPSQNTTALQFSKKRGKRKLAFFSSVEGYSLSKNKWPKQHAFCRHGRPEKSSRDVLSRTQIGLSGAE